MDAAVAGLVGAVIGAIAGLAGGLISHILSARAWLRDKRGEAYASTLRYLGRVTRKRSKINAETTILGEDVVKEWFDDLNEAQTWLSTLSIYCSDIYRETVTDAAESLDKSIGEILSRGARAASGKPGILNEIDKIYDIILDAARKDMRRHVE